MIHETLAPGAEATVDVTFKASRDVDAPEFRVFALANSVKIDSSTMPGTIIAGQSYTLRLMLKMPNQHHLSTARATVLIRAKGKSMGDVLSVRMVLPRMTPTSTPR